MGTAQTPRFTGQPAKMVREWKGEYKIPVNGEVTSLDIKLFGKVAGDRVAPEGEDLLVASGYLDSRDMKAFYGFHRVLLQFGNHSVKWEVTFVIQPGRHPCQFAKHYVSNATHVFVRPGMHVAPTKA